MVAVRKEKKEQYKKFDQINGSHPLQGILPKGHISYPARIRRGGKIAYFNFDLAKEMGLISKSHEAFIDQELESKIIETFSIQIINEFDQMNERQFKESDLKSGEYMATRYLQMQHDDKRGLNSGDGRSIWLGQIKHRGKSWDISGCGTGATRLSPATSKFNKFFETGDPSISYGCGYGELDEGLATSLMSSAFKSNGIKTEESLCVIEFPNNISINIRVYSSLLRPSHLFLYLKQDDLESLRAITDYYIESSRSKKEWANCPKNNKKYDFLLSQITNNFAKMSALFEDEYIFCWLDWDGDNILMDGALIDYGSIRQFGILHHEYRYDDVERFSTSILEQRLKARLMLQNFCQIVSYLKTGEKKSLQDFSGDSALNRFDQRFEEHKLENLLCKIGFSKLKTKQLLKRERGTALKFYKSFQYFERAKSKDGIVKVSDGVTCDAIFNMRKALKEYPHVLISEWTKLADTDFIDMMSSHFAKSEDLEINSYRSQKISKFQKNYMLLVTKCARIFQEKKEDTLASIVKRSEIINKANRITGDAITHIVDLVVNQKKRLGPEKMYDFINEITQTQNFDPDKKINFSEINLSKLSRDVLTIIKENREGL